MGSNNGTKKTKPSKLTQLENEVANLSEQIKDNQKTISQLKTSLAERDLKIQELESKLIYAQQSLLDKATFAIHHYRNQIKNDLDEKLVNPTLTQIQQQIETVQSIVNETKDFIDKKTTQLQQRINLTSDLAHQCPELATKYFEIWVIDPARLLINDTSQTLNNRIKTGQELVEQHLIHPGKFWYDKIIITALALPTQSQVIYQVWLADPLTQKIKVLPVIGKELSAQLDALVKNSITRIKLGAEQSLTNTVDAVKKSPFWDGKQRVAAT